jgi:arylsulfatase A-like enzyme
VAPDTIVAFTSDHGEMLGDHYLFRKSLPYEPSARIPLLIRDPLNPAIRPRTVVDTAVCLEDVMPTLLDLAGVPVPPSVEGRSLAPLMRGEGAGWDRAYVPVEHAPTNQCLTDGREKYIWFTADGREQFFDLARDPQERHDAIRDPACAGRVAAWRERMVKHLAGRPEGFSDGARLIPGRPYPAVLPGAH